MEMTLFTIRAFLITFDHYSAKQNRVRGLTQGRVLKPQPNELNVRGPISYGLRQMQNIQKKVFYCWYGLAHLPLVPHICVRESSTGSNNGLSFLRHQAITWTNVFFSIGPLGTNSSNILIKIHNFYSQKCISKHHLQNGGHVVKGRWFKSFVWLVRTKSV